MTLDVYEGLAQGEKASFLNERLVPRYGDDLYITFIDPVPEDKAFRTTEMQAAVGSQPVLTPNEAPTSSWGQLDEAVSKYVARSLN